MRFRLFSQSWPLYFSLTIAGADLLLTCLLVFYLYKIFDPNYIKDISNAFVTGIIGGMLYLSKAYAFPFFIVHFSFINIIIYYNAKHNERKNGLRNFVVGIFIFLTISGPWIYLISEKYDKITFSTAGEFNYKFKNPKSKFSWSDFQIPPNDTALHGWEDPSYFDMGEWRFHPEYFLKNIYSNILATQDILCNFSFFSSAILIIYFVTLLIPSRKSGIKSMLKILLPFITVILFCAGYCLIFASIRFLWIVYILLILMGFSILEKVINHYKFGRAKKYLLLIIISVSFLILPRWELDKDRLTGKGRYVYELSCKLEDSNIKGKIASNKDWNKTINLALYMSQKNPNIKYFGVPKNLTDLKIYNIDYYFVWKEKKNARDFTTEILSPKIYEDSDLIIYHLRYSQK